MGCFLLPGGRRRVGLRLSGFLENFLAQFGKHLGDFVEEIVAVRFLEVVDAGVVPALAAASFRGAGNALPG
jgi:hypothetical protein